MAVARENRLSSSRAISAVLKKGNSLKCPFFRVKRLPSYRGITQITVITSKKFEPLAVKRNYVRRICTELFRIGLQKNSIPKNYLYVIFPFEEIKTASFKDISSAFFHLFKKIS